MYYYPETELEESVFKERLAETIVRNWHSFPAEIIVEICNIAIDNPEDDFDDIVIPTEELAATLEKKPAAIIKKAMKSPEYDAGKPLIYLDYYGDITPDADDLLEHNGRFYRYLEIVSLAADELKERLFDHMQENCWHYIMDNDFEAVALPLLRLLNLDAAAMMNRKENENE